MTTIEFLRRLIHKNGTSIRHAQERHDAGALARLDETRKHLFTALRAMELTEQIGAMFGEDAADGQ